ncbi:hypothetical protein C5B42_05990 [Candidatus Cerribacteria bacterium 'Amazon FNV 2010 28 9']|uniref:Uncharacterized protein n=1 Tax=Candidatus Cerribacteria bacterium 'Amazon FNV 2010 28 9' TaxID=2081795 RepID=A0A317JN46_9BACT|nr:MAG: hypothetical protein C5B42_05990 [Candidatus Cerribacteria bacterium 'Amazon FNV 2010 28 9']
MNKELQPSPEENMSPTQQSSFDITYDPEPLETILRRAKRLKEIDALLEEAEHISQKKLRQEFEV